ncbi:GMC family oxidoreductase [Streptomyces sp. NPDC047141]|uniref:GMC family oxidoreductase n=1 Tax=Streptomyces sp. NPDC047141 TaxID=3155738 RepID=UPI0033D2F373
MDGADLDGQLVPLLQPDPDDAPPVDPGYCTSPADLDLVVGGLRRALEICASPAMSAYLGPPSFPPATDDAALRVSARTSTVSFNHPAGTCRAGDGEGAVVDALLRVHGVAGLRVADASVMPSLPRGNIHGPTAMIGERAAELLRQTWTPGRGSPVEDTPGTAVRPPRVGPAHLPGGPRTGSRRACAARSASGFGPATEGRRR